MERVTGIEPAYSAWKADVLPLNYTRLRQENWISVLSGIPTILSRMIVSFCSKWVFSENLHQKK